MNEIIQILTIALAILFTATIGLQQQQQPPFAYASIDPDTGYNIDKEEEESNTEGEEERADEKEPEIQKRAEESNTEGGEESNSEGEDTEMDEDAPDKYYIKVINGEKYRVYPDGKHVNVETGSCFYANPAAGTTYGSKNCDPNASLEPGSGVIMSP